MHRLDRSAAKLGAWDSENEKDSAGAALVLSAQRVRCVRLIQFRHVRN
jgi:hypothetical protein